MPIEGCGHQGMFEECGCSSYSLQHCVLVIYLNISALPLQ